MVICSTNQPLWSADECCPELHGGLNGRDTPLMCGAPATVLDDRSESRVNVYRWRSLNYARLPTCCPAAYLSVFGNVVSHKTATRSRKHLVSRPRIERGTP